MKRLCILFGLLLACGAAQTRPLDAVGQCPAGRIVPATGQFEGNAAVLKAVPAFLTKHAAATAQEEAWLHNLSGRSGRNRLHQSGSRHIVLATVCNPGDCESNRAYIAYEPATGLWGAMLYEGRHVRELGERPGDPILPSPLADAIFCAQNLDWGNP